MNLLLTAPFSLDVLDKCISKGIVAVESVELKLKHIQCWGDELPGVLLPYVTCVISILRRFVLSLQS